MCSLALGLGLGIVFSRVLFWLLGLLLGTDLAVAFVIPVSAITSTLGLFGLIFLLTLCYNLLQVKLSKPIELLHGGETGEREPKAHWFLAVLPFWEPFCWARATTWLSPSRTLSPRWYSSLWR